MNRNHLLLGLLASFLAANASEAQGIFLGRSGYNLQYSQVTRRGTLSLSIGGFQSSRFLYGSGPIYSPHYFHGHRFFPPLNQVTVFYSQPAAPSPIVFVMPAPQEEREDGIPRPADPEPPAPLPGQIAGVFRPLEVDNRARAQRAPPPEPEALRKEEVKAPAKPRAKPELVPVSTWIEKGRAAFVAEEFGRAAEFFRRATQDDPGDFQPHFLLSQAYVALGKYRESVEAIQAGMAVRRDWPAAGFKLRELYGHPADYAETMQRLEDALKRHPRDAILQFLLAHQLWFDDRIAEARMLFERARPRFSDPRLIDRFLGAGGPFVRASEF